MDVADRGAAFDGNFRFRAGRSELRPMLAWRRLGDKEKEGRACRAEEAASVRRAQESIIRETRATPKQPNSGHWPDTPFQPIFAAMVKGTLYRAWPTRRSTPTFAPHPAAAA